MGTSFTGMEKKRRIGSATTAGMALMAISANLSYFGEANGQYQDHSFNVAVRVKF